MIVEHLTAGRIALEGSAREKRDVLGDLARLLAEGSADVERAILAGLLERESVMSTGIGHGIAIPHARLEAVPGMRLALARYPRGVDFKSLDHQPVFLAFGVLGPPGSADQHVKLLARIARLVKSATAVPQIMQAADSAAVFEILRSHE